MKNKRLPICALLITVIILTLTACFSSLSPRTPEKSDSDTRSNAVDRVFGNTFISGGDGSELCLKDDGSFYYYAEEDVHNARYYEGTYEVFWGRSAVEKLVSMEEYSLTTEYIEADIAEHIERGYTAILDESDPLMAVIRAIDPKSEALRARYELSENDFCLLVLHNNILVMEPGDIQELGHSSPYAGYFYTERKLLHVTNVNNFNSIAFAYKDSSSNLSVDPIVG